MAENSDLQKQLFGVVKTILDDFFVAFFDFIQGKVGFFFIFVYFQLSSS